MSSIASAEAWLQRAFAPVSLATLNSSAAMLERLDNKYVVSGDVLRQVVGELAASFDILEIDAHRSFTYETCYFDDMGWHSYFDHHQGRRRRAKVRIRKYIETALCFVEVKLKDKRGVTVKKRLPYDLGKFGTLDEAALAFIHDTYHAHYQERFRHRLSRVIDMSYLRTTLVAKVGGERMTIDGNLRFHAPGSSHTLDDDRFIIETKSANGNGIADGVLRAQHQHPTKHCSKYCMGIAMLYREKKHNKFLPALRKLGRIPVVGKV